MVRESNDIEINKIQPIVQRFMSELANKPEEVSLEDFMIELMARELPEKPLSEIRQFCHEILKETDVFNDNREAINNYSKAGGSKNQWLFQKISKKVSERIKAIRSEKKEQDKLSEQEIQADVQKEVERQTEILNENNNLIRAWLRKNKTIEALAKSVNNTLKDKIKSFALLESKFTSTNIREATYSLGKNAAWFGIGSAIVGTAFYFVKQKTNHEEIKTEEAIAVALNESSDTGIKVATAAAIKVSLEKGMIPLLAKSTPAGVITNIACVGIENLKILAKYSKHEIKGIEAMDSIAKTSLTLIYGLGWGGEGAAIGAVLFSFFPIVGTIIGSIFGGMVGYIAGNIYGEGLYAGAKELIGKARIFAEITWDSLCVRRKEEARLTANAMQRHKIKNL